MKKETKKTNENILMIVLAFMSFSVGIWSNYRQLWLQEAGFSVSEISKILSVALVCSSIICLIMTFFSAKIKIKNIMVLSFVFRSISMIALFFVNSIFAVKTLILLGIMCEVIFNITFYPLLTFESKTDEAFQRKTIINYFGKDIGIVGCGLLMGFTIGKYVFDYNTCLLIATISAIIGLFYLVKFKSSQDLAKNPSTLFGQFKDIFSLKLNRIFLYNQLIMNISYGIVFDLIMIILTTYIGFNIAFTSVFIIVCNMLGTVASAILNKYSKNYSIGLSSVIKFGFRAISYIVAFALNTKMSFIIAIVIGYITCRILEDKVTGKFLQIVDENNQLFYGNVRYFIISLGEGIGAFIAGVLLTSSLRLLFLGAAIITILQTIIMLYLSKLRKNIKDA